MPTELRCLVEADDSPIVRLTGVLDRAGVDDVRAALLTRLWQRPGPVIVDLSAVRIADSAARAVIDDVHHAVADWPAAGLLVLDPSGPVGVGAPVYPSLDRALAAHAALTGQATSAAPAGQAASAAPAGEAAEAGPPRAAVLTAELPPTAVAARAARALVTAGCTRWGVPDLIEPARIAVTEMVNNVVTHAGTPMTVRVAARGRALHLAVRDGSARPPAYAGPAPLTSIGGRGLLLIDTVARGWGSTPLPDGKVVWCVLHAEDEAARLG